MVKQGGSVVVRDYAVFDHTMVRFGRGTKISDRFYARQDGTRSYFFTIGSSTLYSEIALSFSEELRQLFESSGFETERCEYLHKKTVNVKEDVNVKRIFIQGRFILKTL